MHTPKQTNLPGGEGFASVLKAPGRGRRAYTRYPVLLDGTLIPRGQQEIPCVIRDFCLNGILLKYQRPVAGKDGFPLYSPAIDEALTVHCLVPDPGGDKKLVFQARIARIVEDGAGLAFINPDHDALQIMQQFALQSPLEDRRNQKPSLRGADGNLYPAGAAGDHYHSVINHCGELVESSLETLLGPLCNKLTSHLFEISRDTRNPEEQNDYFNASEIIKKHADTLVNSVRAGVQIRLSNPVPAENSGEKENDDLSLEDMSLIGDEDLGAWIAISDITGKIEEKNKEELLILEERLSALFNITVRNPNNPYGPALFVEPFQTALNQYNFSPRVSNACHLVFKEILIAESAEFYKKLNARLRENGILPELTYKMIRRAAQIKKGSDPSHDPQAGNPVDVDNAPHAADRMPAGAPSPAATPPPARTGRLAKDAIPQDFYSVVQELRELKQGLNQHKALLISMGQSAAYTLAPLPGSAPQPAEYHSTHDLMAAITDLQKRNSAPSGEEHGAIKTLLLAGLADRNQSGAEKGLSPHDNNILDVAGDLLHAMQNDPLVADSVRPWLKRLELPIIKLALEDPTVFIDQSHIARQVVNKIARLEFYEHKEGHSVQNVIGSAIEHLLQRITQEHGNGSAIFTEILHKLDALIKIQDKAYGENLDDVVRGCEQHPPLAAECETVSDPMPSLAPEELHKWMLHAKRLKKGDYVSYNRPESGVIRLRVAWLNDEHSIYVFIDSKGLRQKMLRVEDLARLIQCGIIFPQTNANDPALDRAQYAIMQELYQQVLHESTHDATTGLINRREFEKKLGEALASAKQNDQRHALLFIDIDKFSAINNSCGYAGGDRLLKDMIALFQDDLAAQAVMARLGSDEFGILLENCTIDDALAIAERKIEAVTDYRLAWDDNLFSVTLSIGLVPVSARSTDVGSLLQSAESSCNVAKDVGGNRLQLFHAGHARIAHRGEVMKWIGKLDKLLEEDGLEIRCQRIDPIDETPVIAPHFEILLGVNDIEGHITSPQEFIKAAEWYRRMPSVDRWVIRKVFHWMAENRNITDAISGFAINLSGQSLNEDGFAEFILREFERAKIPCEKICFEVTETVGISNLSDATLFIERIKDVGCRFSLDDFGSGMSSYGYLKDLPVDIVKIDGSFVQNLTVNSSDYAVVKSITDIAHVMNKQVVAEYVETQEVLNILRDVGVDFAQGYFIDKPGPLSRLLNDIPGDSPAK